MPTLYGSRGTGLIDDEMAAVLLITSVFPGSRLVRSNPPAEEDDDDRGIGTPNEL